MLSWRLHILKDKFSVVVSSEVLKETEMFEYPWHDHHHESPSVQLSQESDICSQ